MKKADKDNKHNNYINRSYHSYHSDCSKYSNHDYHDNHNIIIRTSSYITLGLITTTMLAGIVGINTISVSADDSFTDTISLDVAAVCTMEASVSGTTHFGTLLPGQFTGDIGLTNVNASCNDTGGYAVYAIGYTNNEYGNTNLINTTDATNTIPTGTTTGSNSNWSMKLGQGTGDSATITGQTSGDTEDFYNNYHIVPSTYTKVAAKPSATDPTITGTAFTTTYGAYISSTQAAGTYTGQVKYTLVHPHTEPAPSTLNPNADDISEVTYMQDFAVVSNENRASIIASMVPEQQYTIQDIRDDKYYTIAKYQAGTNSTTSQPIYDVWMTQNLDHDIDTNYNYTNDNTDIGYNTTTNTYGSASWTPMRGTYATNDNTWSSWDGYGATTPESYDPGTLYWNGTAGYYGSESSCTAAGGTWNSNNNVCNLIASTGNSHYHLGNYYNWTAALATNDSSTINDDELVEQSICPAGWTLPRIGEGEDTFYSLWNQYGFSSKSYNDANSNGNYDTNEAALWTSPLYFAAGGGYDDGLYYVGYYGDFWSPVSDDSGSARRAYFGADGGANPSSGTNRSGGLSVRCVLRPVAATISD